MALFGKNPEQEFISMLNSIDELEKFREREGEKELKLSRAARSALERAQSDLKKIGQLEMKGSVTAAAELQRVKDDYVQQMNIAALDLRKSFAIIKDIEKRISVEEQKILEAKDRVAKAKRLLTMYK